MSTALTGIGGRADDSARSMPLKGVAVGEERGCRNKGWRVCAVMWELVNPLCTWGGKGEDRNSTDGEVGWNVGQMSWQAWGKDIEEKQRVKYCIGSEGFHSSSTLANTSRQKERNYDRIGGDTIDGNVVDHSAACCHLWLQWLPIYTHFLMLIILLLEQLRVTQKSQG